MSFLSGGIVRERKKKRDPVFYFFLSRVRCSQMKLGAKNANLKIIYEINVRAKAN